MFSKALATADSMKSGLVSIVTACKLIIGFTLSVSGGVGKKSPRLVALLHCASADISDLSAQEVVLSDSKVFDVNGQKLRVSVHETTSAPAALERTSDFKVACAEIKAEEGVDEVLFFVVDILKEEATFVPLDFTQDPTGGGERKQLVYNNFTRDPIESGARKQLLYRSLQGALKDYCRVAMATWLKSCK